VITIWRRCDCTQIDDTAPRFVWVRVTDYEIARAANEAARRRWHALDREDLRNDIRAIVREEVARAVEDARHDAERRFLECFESLGRHG
jgi:hypothetical protein